MLWYTSSASGNVIGKLVLNEFPYPVTMTMVQLASAALYLGPILKLLGVPNASEIPRRYYLVMIIPLAFGKFVSSLSSHISIWKVSVSYAHTVKATLPMFTVILLRVFMKEKQTFSVYLSLLPIIGGVIIATVTEISFDILGLVSALFATLGFSLQTIFSKKALKDTGLHHMNLLLTLSRLSALCFLPVWLLLDVTRMVYDENVINHDGKAFAIFLILIDGLLNMMQNVLAFTVLSMVNALSYAVANATKRVVIIGASLVLLRNPVTLLNVVGMLIAVFGVLCYNKAKYDQNRAASRQAALPFVHSESDLQVLEHKHPVPHSMSVMNLNDPKLKQNGFVHDHILFQNPELSEQVQLIPVSHNTPHDANYERRESMEQNVHARTHSIYDV